MKFWQFLMSKGVMAAIAFVGFALAIYSTFFYERQGHLTIVRTPPARLFDVREPVGSLEISYGGEDLRRAGKTLWVVNLLIANTGNAAIRKSDFDDLSPVGVLVSGGQIVEKPNVQSVIPYIQENARVTSDGQRLLLPALILEPGDALGISFLVLGPQSTSPELSPLGKVTGMRSLSIVGLDRSDVAFAAQVYGGPWTVQFARTATYSAVGLAVALIGTSLIAGTRAAVAMATRRRRRKTWVQDVEQVLPQTNLSKGMAALAQVYREMGPEGLQDVSGILQEIESDARHAKLVGRDPSPEGGMLEGLAELPLVRPLVAARLLTFKGRVPIVAETLVRELENLAKLLDIKLESDEPYRWMRGRL